MLEQLKTVSKRLKQEFDVYPLVIKHPETPLFGKALLGLAVAYLLFPFDLIPDFIPLLGQLDDVVIIPLLVVLALRIIPAHIIQTCREEVNNTI